MTKNFDEEKDGASTHGDRCIDSLDVALFHEDLHGLEA